MMSIPKRTEELVEEYNFSKRMSTWILAGLEEDTKKLLGAVQELKKHHSDLDTWHTAASQIEADSSLSYLIHPGHERAAGLHRVANQALQEMISSGDPSKVSEYQNKARQAHNMTLEIHKSLTRNAPDQIGVVGSDNELKKVEMILERLMELIGHGESLETVLRHDKGHDDWHRENGQSPCTSDEDCAAKAAEIKDRDKCTCGQTPCQCGCNCGLETCPKCGRQVVASSWVDQYSNLDSDW